jgi:peptidyl-prolyl cis-trans isomerase C
MRVTSRHWGAALTLALTALPLFAQTPPAVPTTPPTPPPAPVTTPAAPAAPAVSPTAVAASVNGEPIYEVAVQRGLERVPPQKREQARPDLLNFLVDNLLIEQSLKQGGVAVEKTEIDKRVEEMRAELKKGGKEFDKMLTELKVSEDELRSHIAADLRWYKYATAQATDKVLRDLFDSNKDMFDGTMVRARHILVTPTAGDPKAEAAVTATLRGYKAQVIAAVEAGLTTLPPATATDKLAAEKARLTLMSNAFSDIAKTKSECPTKLQGGDVGWFQKAGFMVAPFSQAAFTLQPGQMSDIVKSPFGLHLILVTDRRPGRDVKFEDVKEMVKEVYCDRLRENLAAKVRAQSKVVINPAPK